MKEDGERRARVSTPLALARIFSRPLALCFCFPLDPPPQRLDNPFSPPPPRSGCLSLFLLLDLSRGHGECQNEREEGRREGEGEGSGGREEEQGRRKKEG
eukprot:3453654-Rhodomonas_salina.1